MPPFASYRDGNAAADFTTINRRLAELRVTLSEERSARVGRREGKSAMRWTRIAAVVPLVLVSALGGYQVKVQAQQDFPPPCRVVIPVEWGKYSGSIFEAGVVFEDKNGTLRIIQQLPCTLDGTPNGPPRVIAEIYRR